MSDAMQLSTAYALGRILRVIVNGVRDLVGLAGCGLASYGFFEIYRPLGMIVAGALMAGICFLLARGAAD